MRSKLSEAFSRLLKLARELEWIRQSPRARQAKSKARITAYESLLAEAKEKSPDTAQIIVPIGPRLGDLVIEASSLAKGFEDKLLIEDLSFKLPPGGIVGVIWLTIFYSNFSGLAEVGGGGGPAAEFGSQMISQMFES